TTPAARASRANTLGRPTIPIHPRTDRPVKTETEPKARVRTPKRIAKANATCGQFTARVPATTLTRRNPAQRINSTAGGAGEDGITGGGVPAIDSTWDFTSLAFW